jgi:phosphoribosylanthranilate isomerase
MAIQVKICGVSTEETLDAAILGGATHIGFNFFAKSPRSVTLERAAALVRRLPEHVTAIGLVVDEERDRIDAIRAQTGIQTMQLHGEESPEFAASLGGDVWKAIPVKTRGDLALAANFAGAVSHLLYDAKPPKGADLPGGTGMRFDWSLLDGFAHPLPWLLAGGLDAGNVAEAIGRTGARFIDVASGVESAPGIKDVDKIAAFLKATADL